MDIHNLILLKIEELVVARKDNIEIQVECDTVLNSTISTYGHNDFTLPQLAVLFKAERILIKRYLDAGGGVIPTKQAGQMNQLFLYPNKQIVDIFKIWSLQIPMQAICNFTTNISWMGLSTTQVFRILKPVRISGVKINHRDVVSYNDVISFFQKRYYEYEIRTTWINVSTFAKEVGVTEGTVTEWIRKKVIISEMSKYFYYIPPVELERIKSYKSIVEASELVSILPGTFYNSINEIKQIGIVFEELNGAIVISLQEIEKLKNAINEGKIFSRIQDNKKRVEIASVIASRLPFYLERFEQLKVHNFEQLTSEQQYEMVISAKSYRDNVFNYFVKYFHTRIKKLAELAIWKFGKGAPQYSDCYHYGLLGLLNAIQLYTDQPDFIGYAYNHIKWKIYKSIQEEKHFTNHMFPIDEQHEEISDY